MFNTTQIEYLGIVRQNIRPIGTRIEQAAGKIGTLKAKIDLVIRDAAIGFALSRDKRAMPLQRPAPRTRQELALDPPGHKEFDQIGRAHV